VPDLTQRDDVQQPGGPDEAALAIVARHALHDEELIAAYAAGALEGDDEADERTRARSLVDRCPTCRALRDDVQAIGASLRVEAAATMKAPRDFRLTVEDAHRLGGTVITRGPLASFGRWLMGVARPVGASVAALGLVGVLVSSAVFGAAGLASRPAADSGATTAGAPQGSAAAAAPSSFEIAANPGGSPKASERIEFGPMEPESGSGVAPTAWLLLVSVFAIVGGIGLFWYGTRAANGRRARTGS
jgi:hypothetical protein